MRMRVCGSWESGDSEKERGREWEQRKKEIEAADEEAWLREGAEADRHSQTHTRQGSKQRREKGRGGG